MELWFYSGTCRPHILIIWTLFLHQRCESICEKKSEIIWNGWKRCTFQCINRVFVKSKKSEIRLKSELSHPCFMMYHSTSKTQINLAPYGHSYWVKLTDLYVEKSGYLIGYLRRRRLPAMYPLATTTPRTLSYVCLYTFSVVILVTNLPGNWCMCGCELHRSLVQRRQTFHP